MKKKEIRVRCWIDIDGTKFFGPGRSELLALIQQSGSIAKAAKSMGMSYKKAWAMVEEMNTRGAQPFVITHKGGQQGGGTELTEAGKKLVTSFEKLMNRLKLLVEKENELLKLI